MKYSTIFLILFRTLPMGNYINNFITNPNKTVLYLGVTNDLERRLDEHYQNRGNKKSFAGRYHCFKLVYWKWFDSMGIELVSPYFSF